MADIFTSVDAKKLLKGKTVWFFGDSNIRGLYKDLLWLLEKNSLINLAGLRSKLEISFLNDRLINGGTLHRGRNFQEIRQYKNFNHEIDIEFTFITQCNSDCIRKKLLSVEKNINKPDVVVINSCLWDITRWGPDSVKKYKLNICDLIQTLKTCLPESTKVIWMTTPPISNDPYGGFFIQQIEFLKHTLRFDVMEANTFVSRQFSNNGFDILDIHYHLLLQIHRRRPDGIHWNPEAVRHITNLFLTHLCISWNLPLPGNFKSPLLDNLLVESIKNNFKEKTNETADKEKKLTTNLLPKINKQGQKRDRSPSRDKTIGGSSSKIDFTTDDFEYNFKTKKFKL